MTKRERETRRGIEDGVMASTSWGEKEAEALSAIATHVQSEAPNLAWLNNNDKPHANNDYTTKKKKKKNLKKKSKRNQNSRGEEKEEAEEIEEGPKAVELHEMLSLATVAIHTQGEEDLEKLKAACVKLARENARDFDKDEDEEEEAQLWAQEMLCASYSAFLIFRKFRLRGLDVEQ